MPGYRPLLVPTVRAIERAVIGKTSLTQADLELIGAKHEVHPNTVRAIWNRQRARLGLPARGHKKLSEHEESRLCQLYLSGCHVVETSAHFGISRSAFYEVLTRRGVLARRRQRAA